MNSELLRKIELQAEDDQALWTPFINAEKEQRDRIDLDAERTRYISTRDLLMEY